MKIKRTEEQQFAFDAGYSAFCHGIAIESSRWYGVHQDVFEDGWNEAYVDSQDRSF